MADQGAILVSKVAVKLTGLSELVYSLDGFLTGFTVTATGNKYIYLVEEDVIKSKLDMFQQTISKGYYTEDSFLEYRRTKNLSKLSKEYDHFISAEIEDIINVKKIKLSSPFDVEEFGFWEYYSLIYQGHSLVDELGQIIKSVPYAPQKLDMELNSVAKKFYEKNIHHNSTATTNEEKYERALLIAKTAIYIHNINAKLFPLFSNVALNNTELNNLKIEQNNYWKTDVFQNPSLNDIQAYFDSVYNFFRAGYINQKRIEEAKGYEKIYWLALCLSKNALKLLTALNKIALLSWMQVNVRIGQHWLFFNDNENLVLKIIDSITEEQADLFLDNLFKYSDITYDNLFDRLADDKGFLQNNSINDSTFGLGEDNRYNFIISLYLVWQVSSYNPYQNDIFSENNLKKFNYNNYLGTNPDPTNSFFDKYDSTKVNFQAQPISLNYSSTSSSGYYIDNFYFRSTNIKGNLNHAHLDNLGTDLRDFTNLHEAPKNKILAFQKEYRLNSKDGLYGTYDYLQAVSLVNSNIEAVVKIPTVSSHNPTNADINNLIPIFVLKYIDDKNLESNIETTVGYLIDIASLYFGGTALVSKFRYIRSVSGFSEAIIAGSEHGIGTVVKLYIGFGTEAINFTAASLSLYCKIITDSSNHDKPWLINMKETLMWIEIFSGVGSVVAENMLRKKTKALVEDFNTNNNWPTEFTEDPRGLDAQLALQKIAGVDVAFDLINFTSDALTRLERKFDLDVIDFEKNLYSLAQKQQIIAKGFAKGLSTDEIVGIIHQACRKRNPTITITISEFEIRIERYLLAKRRRFPFTFETKDEFDSYVSTHIEKTIDDFGLPNKNKYYGGSSITSNTSFSGGIQDTDWWLYWENESEIYSFIDKQEAIYIKWGEILGKKKQWAKDEIRSMKRYYKNRGFIPKEKIIRLNGNQVETLNENLQNYPELLKTDITIKLRGINDVSPSILYKN